MLRGLRGTATITNYRPALLMNIYRQAAARLLWQRKSGLMYAPPRSITQAT